VSLLAKIGDFVQAGDKQGMIYDRVRSERAFFVAIPRGEEELGVDWVTVPYNQVKVIKTKGEVRKEHFKWWRANGKSNTPA
jgi:hypothetical protein